MTKRFLLDTNVVSETRKRQADAQVVRFLSQQNATSVFLSALTIGELRKGAKAKHKSDPAAGEALGVWIDGIEKSFVDRILSVDARVATLWGDLSADRSRAVVDTLIAATAIAHGLIVVTRNTKDFAACGVSVLDPFSDAGDRPASSERS